MSDAIALEPAKESAPSHEPHDTKERAPTTLPGALALLATTRGDDVALREKRLGVWREISWRAYHEHVSAVGRALFALGVRAGDHVSILSDNRPEWVYADLGAQGIGARSIGIYQTNPPGDVAYILAHSGSKVLICEDQEQVDKAIHVRDQTPSVTHVVVIDPRGTRGYDDERLLSWDDFLAKGRALLAEEPGWFDARVRELDPQSPAMIVYTSGTTGQPKGAMLTHENALAVAESSAQAFGSRPDDTLLSYLPLCHVAEKIFTLLVPLRTGAVVHFGESLDTVREDLREVSPTVFLGVPRIWEKMHASVVLKMQDASWLKRTIFRVFTKAGLAIAEKRRAGTLSLVDRLVWALGDLLLYRPLQERLGLRRCRLPVTGAAPISADLIAWFHSVGVPVVEGYGQTECTGASHVNPPERIKLGTVGKLLPGVEHKLAEDGEILVCGRSVFRGYLHDDEATQRTIDDEGWLATGDVGVIDDEGYLTITGRKKEILITAGGKNLSPEKIENALKMSGYLKEAVAIGDGRRFVSALLQIDAEAVGDWATRKGIPYTSFEDLTEKPEVRKLVEAEVEKSNALLAQVEQVRAFRLFPKELRQEDDELTPTQKVRRREIHARYAALIESMYANKSQGA